MLMCMYVSQVGILGTLLPMKCTCLEGPHQQSSKPGGHHVIDTHLRMYIEVRSTLLLDARVTREGGRMREHPITATGAAIRILGNSPPKKGVQSMQTKSHRYSEECLYHTIHVQPEPRGVWISKKWEPIMNS